MLSAIDGASTSTLESGLRGLRVLSRPLFRSRVSRTGKLGHVGLVHNTGRLPPQSPMWSHNLLKTVQNLMILWPGRHPGLPYARMVVSHASVIEMVLMGRPFS